MDRGADHEERIRVLEVPQVVATLHIKVDSDEDVVATGNGRFIFAIAQDMHRLRLTRVEMFVTTVSSSGIVQVQIRNITGAVDMLATRVQVDASEKNSKTAATAAVIDTDTNFVSWGDEIAIDVDAAGTGAKGLGVILEFS